MDKDKDRDRDKEKDKDKEKGYMKTPIEQYAKEGQSFYVLVIACTQHRRILSSR